FLVVGGERRVVGEVDVGGGFGGVIDPNGQGVGGAGGDAEGADAERGGDGGDDGEGGHEDAGPEASDALFCVVLSFEGGVLFLLPAQVVLIGCAFAHGFAPRARRGGHASCTLIWARRVLFVEDLQRARA